MALCSIFWLPSTCDRIFSSNLLFSLITRSLEEGRGGKERREDEGRKKGESEEEKEEDREGERERGIREKL